MTDYTERLLSHIFDIARQLEKEVVINNKIITIGEFKYDYSVQPFHEALLPCIGYIHAFYKKQLYGWME